MISPPLGNRVTAAAAAARQELSSPEEEEGSTTDALSKGIKAPPSPPCALEKGDCCTQQGAVESRTLLAGSISACHQQTTAFALPA